MHIRCCIDVAAGCVDLSACCRRHASDRTHRHAPWAPQQRYVRHRPECLAAMRLPQGCLGAEQGNRRKFKSHANGHQLRGQTPRSRNCKAATRVEIQHGSERNLREMLLLGKQDFQSVTISSCQAFPEVCIVSQNRIEEFSSAGYTGMIAVGTCHAKKRFASNMYLMLLLASVV